MRLNGSLLPMSLATLLIVALLYSPAQALSLKPVAFSALKQSADAAVLARVESIAYERNDEPGMHGVQTRVTFARQQTLAGAMPERFSLMTLGGRVGKRTIAVPGAPEFSTGERVVLLLRKLEGPGDAEYGLLGHGMSVFRLSADGRAVIPDVAVPEGPPAAGEAWDAFAARFQAGALKAPLPPVANVHESASPLAFKLMLAGLAAALLLIAVLLRRRARGKALLLAGALGLSGLFAAPRPSRAETVASRPFALSGPKWTLNQPLRGRVLGGRILWVRGVGTPDIPDDTAFGIIAGKFQQWEDIPESAVAFRQDGISIESGTGVDERNTVSFLEKVPRKAFDDLTLAITFIVFDDTEMVDTDIVFNDRDFTWTPSGAAYSLDVVALHEIGHLIGLDHTADPQDVMFPVAQGNFTFSAGDIAGAATLYPVSPAQPPVAVVFASPAAGPAPLAVSFSATPSASNVAQPLSVSWDFGDGTPGSTEVSPAHTYAVAGTYKVTLTVSDGGGASSSSATIVAGAAAALNVEKFAFKSNLLAPLRSSKGRDSLSMTLSGVEILPGDRLSLSLGRISLRGPAGGILLDERMKFRGELPGGGMLSASVKSRGGELAFKLRGAALGIGLDPRGANDTSETGNASFPVVLLIERAGQTITATGTADFAYKVGIGKTSSGLLEKSISGKK